MDDRHRRCRYAEINCIHFAVREFYGGIFISQYFRIQSRTKSHLAEDLLLYSGSKTIYFCINHTLDFELFQG